jgi:hypothetical protein
MEINYCLFTLLRDNGTKAVQYHCVAKEMQQCCTSALLSNRAPTSRCYGNHNTQQYYPLIYAYVFRVAFSGFLTKMFGSLAHTLLTTHVMIKKMNRSHSRFNLLHAEKLQNTNI